MDTHLERQTEIIFKHHLESILAKDVDGVLQGFAEDAVVFSPDGPIRGREQIRADVNEFLHHLTPKFLNDFKVGRPPLYQKFQDRTTRQIPMVLLTPCVD